MFGTLRESAPGVTGRKSPVGLTSALVLIMETGGRHSRNLVMKGRPMKNRLTYWKCPKCHGTGERIVVPGHVEHCSDCAGTGNALVDGKARAHAAEIERLLSEAR